MFLPFTVWINCSRNLKIFANFRSLEQFFLRVGQKNFGNKIPFLYIANSKYLTYGKENIFFPTKILNSVGKTRNRLNFETFSDLHNLIFHVIYESAIKQTFTYGYLPLIISTSVPGTLDFRRRGGSCKLSNDKLSKVRSNKNEHVACKQLH